MHWYIVGLFISGLIVNIDALRHIPLYNDLGQVYLVNIGIGTPSQNFTVIIDTQSSDLWVPSPHCKKSMCPVSRFQPQKSTTFKSTDIPFGYYYGDGEINGTYVKDTVILDGIQVRQQQFALVNRVSKSVIAADAKRRDEHGGSSVSVQGVLGLGFPDLVQVPTKYDPFFFSSSSGQDLNGVFSIYTNSIEEKGWSGELTLGGFNADKLKGSISFVSISPISTDGDDTTPPTYIMWVIRAQSIGVSNIHRNKTTRKTSLPVQGKYVMIDTGTTLSYVGGLYASQLVSALNTAYSRLDTKTGCYYVNCDLRHSKDMIDIDLARYSTGTAGTVRIGIPVKDFIFDVAGDQCMFSICGHPKQEQQKEMDTFIFGQSIIRSLYLVFDARNKQIGFASPVHSSTTIVEIVNKTFL
ncbi:hypothetical protein HPULCUR_010932 [Helicostylum pulchrum]|uniref:rhizopuspepsin n=1 Tax=Helicostylum pulchrum TaxID=562976 RepID=A0ABP9YER2_9FUNG